MLEYCRFGKDGIDDFRSVILPNVWEQLALTEDYDAQGLRLIGALDDGEPVGALIARFLEKEEVYINSLYVMGDHRRQGIGSQMIRELCIMAGAAYTHSVSEDFPLFFHTEYILPGEDCAIMENFLKKQGFRDFMEKDPTYLLEKQEVKKSVEKNGRANPEIRNLTQLRGYDYDLFADTFEAAGLTGTPDLCFFHGTEDDADFMAFAVPGGEKDFYLVSNDGGAEPEAAVCADTVVALFNALCGKYSDFSLIVDGELNASLPLWKQLVENGAFVCRRQEAGMYVVFNA